MRRLPVFDHAEPEEPRIGRDEALHALEQRHVQDDAYTASLRITVHRMVERSKFTLVRGAIEYTESRKQYIVGRNDDGWRDRMENIKKRRHDRRRGK